MYVAKEYLGLEVEEREVLFEEVQDFAECGLWGQRRLFLLWERL